MLEERIPAGDQLLRSQPHAILPSGVCVVALSGAETAEGAKANLIIHTRLAFDHDAQNVIV